MMSQDESDKHKMGFPVSWSVLQLTFSQHLCPPLCYGAVTRGGEWVRLVYHKFPFPYFQVRTALAERLGKFAKKQLIVAAGILSSDAGPQSSYQYANA
jgi:hypothetical protein